MCASVHSLTRINSVRTLCVELRLLKHSNLPAWKLASVSKNKIVSKKCSEDENKIVKNHRKSIGNEGIEALGQPVSVHESFAFGPKFAAGTGIESNLNLLSKWIVIGGFYTVILLRHDQKALWLAMGANLNGVLSIILKKIIKQERPSRTSNSDFGMPSTHAQSIFYNVLMAILSLMEFHGTNGSVATIAGTILALGSYLSWLRISQKDHTVSQVMVGALIGSTFSISWFWLWEAIVVKAYFLHLWIRLVVVSGGLGTSLLLTLLTLRRFREWNSEAE